MKPSLRALTIGFLAAFLVATAGTGLATYRLTLGTIDRLVDRRIENVSAVVAADGRRATAPRLLARIAALARRRDTGDIGFQLTDAAGRRLGREPALAEEVGSRPGHGDLRPWPAAPPDMWSGVDGKHAQGSHAWAIDQIYLVDWRWRMLIFPGRVDK